MSAHVWSRTYRWLPVSLFRSAISISMSSGLIVYVVSLQSSNIQPSSAQRVNVLPYQPPLHYEHKPVFVPADDVPTAVSDESLLPSTATDAGQDFLQPTTLDTHISSSPGDTVSPAQGESVVESPVRSRRSTRLPLRYEPETGTWT